jgi:hypothetical protein
LEDALQDADLVLLLVAHRPLKELRPDQAASLMRGRMAVDVVNGWDAPSWQREGFTIYRLGVGKLQVES